MPYREGIRQRLLPALLAGLLAGVLMGAVFSSGDGLLLGIVLFLSALLLPTGGERR